jgi:hypothetical protein
VLLEHEEWWSTNTSTLAGLALGPLPKHLSGYTQQTPCIALL